MSQKPREIEMPPIGYNFPPELNPEIAPVQTVAAAPVHAPEPQHEPQQTEYQQDQQVPMYDDSVSDQVVEQEEPKKGSYQQENFKAMREETRRIQKERDLFEYQLEQMKLQEQERNRPKQEVAPQEEFDFDINIDDSELVDAKQMKQVAKAHKQTRQELNDLKAMYRQATVESQVRMKYPDWDKVATPENISKFAKLEPELAETVRQNKDPYLQLVSIYKMIKGANIASNPVDVSSIDDDRRRIEQNSSRPRPTASITPNHSSKPLSVANDYAVGRINRDQLREENRKMNDIIRGPR